MTEHGYIQVNERLETIAPDVWAIGECAAKIAMANVLRTHTLSETSGFIKALISADTDQILGFTALGVSAGETMGAVQIAMTGHMPYTLIRDAILTHPTLIEGLDRYSRPFLRSSIHPISPEKAR